MNQYMHSIKRTIILIISKENRFLFGSYFWNGQFAQLRPSCQRIKRLLICALFEQFEMLMLDLGLNTCIGVKSNTKTCKCSISLSLYFDDSNLKVQPSQEAYLDNHQHQPWTIIAPAVELFPAFKSAELGYLKFNYLDVTGLIGNECSNEFILFYFSVIKF